jgi:TetR/AcrR family transcriptional repressor of nem operon
MARDGTATRERILDATERLVLRQGFAGTSVDAVAAEAGVAKGAFFHHFPSKAALALELVRRYSEADAAHLDTFLARAERLSRDPLQQLLLFVGLFEDAATELSGEDPGCLYASFCYERQLLGDETRALIAASIERWRERLVPRLRVVAELHPPRLPVDLESLADLVLTAFEGGFVLSRAVGNPAIVAQQLRHVRNYLELLFG